jgi:N-acyl-D-amino-acid deacylase
MDILIKNGTVVDGTGVEPYKSSVAVSSSGFITGLGDEWPEVGGSRVIDAEGLHVMPGFIDVHSHGDLGVFNNDEPNPKLMQGVTTEIVGNCGLSVAPVTRRHRGEWAAQYEGVWGRSSTEWDWASFGDYLDALEGNGLQINVGSQVGFGTLRLEAVGWKNRPATARESSRMQELAEEAACQGAFGLSFGLVYVPACYASRAELVDVSRAAAREDMLLNFHIRSEGDNLLESLDEVVYIAQQSQGKLHVSHLKAFGKNNWGKVDSALERIHEAGMDITFDLYPYAVGSTTLNALLPPWVLDGGTEKMLQRLNRKSVRDRIREDIKRGIDGWENYLRLTGAEKVMVTNLKTSDFGAFDSRFLVEIMKARMSDEVDTLCDIIAAEKGGASMLMHAMSEEGVVKILRDGSSMIGTDGLYSGMPHPRLYGSYPTFVKKYVLGKRIMSLQEGVRKMTSYPAHRFGIEKRGLIREGYHADLVIIDLDRFDSPAGFGDSKKYATGLEYVLVNGQVLVDRGEFKRALPGLLLRKGA